MSSGTLFTLYAWPLSYYSGKARAYLRYKRIPYVEKEVRLWTFRAIKKKTGAAVMPVLVTPEGRWLQDTSDIMDQMEQRFPQAPVLPATPRQRIASYIIEAWGDEFWLSSAMHYRWSFPENFTQLFQTEGGDHLLPFAPRFIKNRAVAKAAGLMRSFLPGLGVIPEQVKIIESWTESTLDLLDAHFAKLLYLFGTRPSYGDFGLIGPLFAHLGRDPYPRRELIESRPNLARWIARMQRPDQPLGGEFLPDDEVAATLEPVLKQILTEFWPYLEQTGKQVSLALPRLKAGRGFSRVLGPIEYPAGNHRFKRNATPFSLWMAQRAFDAYRVLSAKDRTSVDLYFKKLGRPEAMQMKIEPRLKRRGLHVVPE